MDKEVREEFKYRARLSREFTDEFFLELGMEFRDVVEDNYLFEKMMEFVKHRKQAVLILRDVKKRYDE